MVKRLAAAMSVAGLFLFPAAAEARLITKDEARSAVVRKAKQTMPSPWSRWLYRSEWATEIPPRRWKVTPGFCRRQTRAWYPGGHRANCWVTIDFPQWPGCQIYDLWGAHLRRSGRVKVWQWATWTTYSVECPGFGLIEAEELDRR